jgi:hypothetical protein
VRPVDLGNDDTIDLLVSRGPELLLLEQRSGAELLLGDASLSRWTPSPLVLPHLSAPPSGTFTDCSSEASLPLDALAWCVAEDFDADQDVDLLLGGPGALHLMDNQRAGKFVDVAARVLAGATGMAREPLVADLDGDARPDLFEPGTPARLWRQRADGTFTGEASRHSVPGGAVPRALDLDLDGTLDVLWASADAVAEGALGFGLPVERRSRIEGVAAPAAPLVFADLDHDLDPDLARVTDRGLEILRCEGPAGHAARLELRGLKDNRRGVGALVEARTPRSTSCASRGRTARCRRASTCRRRTSRSSTRSPGVSSRRSR